MFITKKKHEAIVAAWQRSFGNHRDRIIEMGKRLSNQERTIREQSAELERFRNGRARSNAALAAANAARSEAARGKGE